MAIAYLTLVCEQRNYSDMPTADHPLMLYRARRGITLRQMAKTLEVNQSTLSRIETGKITPRFELAQKILQVTHGEVRLECPSCGRAISAAA